MTRRAKIKTGKNIILIGVLKNKRDLNILLKKHWYRIPEKYTPIRRFQYLAFYQPKIFGQDGNCIRYYAPVLEYKIVKRRRLLPGEPRHPNAGLPYTQIYTGVIKELPRLIKNKPPRRVIFGFTTLARLLASKNILELYNIAPTEEIMAKTLRQAGIPAVAQHYTAARGRRYRLDFAVFCKQGGIAIECDNKKAHQGPAHRAKDRAKDTNLRRLGWTVMRFPEEEIVFDTKRCVSRLKFMVKRLGGLAS